MGDNAINQVGSSKRRGMFWENDLRSVLFDLLSVKSLRHTARGRN